MAMDDGYLGDIPSELVVRAQQSMEFALKLLDPATRAAAISDAGVYLTDDESEKLNLALDQIARMSFQDVLQALKDVGVTRMM
jgi:hypothetical protein